MRKIRLSDTDLEFFDLEISPAEFTFFQKHKEAFRCMWKEQGKPFWTKFTITFRSFTVKHGVIKQMSHDSPKFENLLDHAFIYVHEQYVDGKESSARAFITDIALLAQNQNKFQNLDSKSFSKDPFYSRETRDLFRRFFGSPDQKSSYLKVYVLSPIYLRFGGSVCRCLKKWMDAPPLDPKDESYWVPPSPSNHVSERRHNKVLMCTDCLDDCGTKYFKEKLCGQPSGPKFIEYWRLGDPRFNDNKNPLYNPSQVSGSDWRENLSVEDFRDFLHYAKFKYGTDDDKCKECLSLDNQKIHFCKRSECSFEKKKKKKKKKKEKAESSENRTDEEIQQLVDHINGKVNLNTMPSSTKGGVDVGTTDDSKEKEIEEKKKKKRIFGKHSKVTDDFKYGIVSGVENLKKQSVIGGFKVMRIEDERNLASEITIKVETLKGEDLERKTKGKLKDESSSQNLFPLSAPLIRSKIDNLPEKMEWWEGKGWCACVLDYEVEERLFCKNPTNFTIKISGTNEDAIKRTMFKLLFYVSNRKKRPCPGWTMDDDDVVACILPDDSTDQEGITICIQRGFRFEERLTDEERKSLQKQYDPCQPKKKKVLMTLDGKDAAMFKGEEGRKNLRELLAKVSGGSTGYKEGKQLYLNDGSTIRVNTPPMVNVRNSDGSNPTGAFPDEGPLWDQMQRNPDTFELFVMVDREKEPELRKHGLKPVDLSNFKEAQKKNCKFCHSSPYECKCNDYKKNFSTIHCIKNLDVEIDSEALVRKVVELQNDEMDIKKLREIIELEYDEIPELLPLDILEQENEDIPDLLETSDSNAEKTAKPQDGENNKNVKIQELTEETEEKKSAESQVIEHENEDIPDLLEMSDSNTEKTAKPQDGENNTNVKIRELTEETEEKKSAESQVIEHENEDIPDLLETSDSNTEKTAKPQDGENNKNVKIRELTEETEEKKSAESQVIEIVESQTEDVTEKEDDKETKTVQAEEKLNDEEPSSVQITNLENKEMVDSADENSVELQTEDSSKLPTETEPVAANDEVIQQKPKDSSKIPTETESFSANDEIIQQNIKDTSKSLIETEPVAANDEVIQQKSKDTSKSFIETEPVAANDEVIQQKPKNTSKIPTETDFFSANDEVIQQKTEDVPEIHTDIAQLENMTLHEDCEDKDGGKLLVLEQKTLDVKDEQFKFDISEENGITESYTGDHNDFDKDDESEHKKLGVFKFTAKSSSSETKIPKIPKSPVKANSKTKSSKSTITGTLNFKITADKMPKKLNLNMEAHMPSTKTDANHSDDINGSFEATDKNGEEKECEINTEEKEKEYVGNCEIEVPESNLRRCAKCDTEEPYFKAFKKCQKCKIEFIINARYYCGRECQIADWSEKHKKEHKENLLD